MEKEFFPPLPDPAENQPPEARRVMGERLIKQARHELDTGDRLQAGEKAWGAAVQYLKIIAEERGWNHTSNRQLESVGKQLAAEYAEYSGIISGTLADAYHKGHENFYENRRSLGDVEDAVEGIERVLPVLDRLAYEEPRSIQIDSNSQLRRLKVLTSNDELQVGDSSPVEFSLRERYNRGKGEGRVVRESGLTELPTLQDIIRDLMRTLLEGYPGLLTDEDLRNLEDMDYCQHTMGFRGTGVPILRPIELGPKVSGHNRYWTKPYDGRYFVSKEWWATHHSHNADSLLRWVEQLINRELAHPGSDALRRHRDELQLYLEA